MRVWSRVYRLFPIALAVLVAACSALELRDANSQLTTLYMAARSEDGIAKVNAEAGFNTLAVDAAAQAEETRGDQNKIAFYRVAAVAAWQAGNTVLMMDSVSKGRALCTPENEKLVPRDCGMLLVIPKMASVDELTNELNASPQPSLARKKEMFNSYELRVGELIDDHATIDQLSTDPLLSQTIGNRVGEIICNAMYVPLYGRILREANSDADLKKDLICRMSALLGKAETSGIDLERSNLEDQNENPFNCATDFEGASCP